jgi:hypothetical protein
MVEYSQNVSSQSPDWIVSCGIWCKRPAALVKFDSLGAPSQSHQGASDEFPQLEEYGQYLSAVVDEESNPRVNAIAKVFGEALERDLARLGTKRFGWTDAGKPW